MIGSTLGGAIGGALDPPKGPNIKGPRLEDLKQQTATYGAFIPRVYGTIDVYGNVFWLENNKLQEIATTQTSGGGKGGAPSTSQTTYVYKATFALGLCEGPIYGIKRIWISGKIWYNKGVIDEQTLNVSNDKETKFKLFLGTDDQMPAQRMEADVGTDNCPAYRGLAYIVFHGLDLAPYGNTLAAVHIKVEVIKNGDIAYTQTKKFSSTAIGPSFDVAYSDNYAYVGAGNKIAIYNAQNGGKPKFVKNVSYAGNHFSLQIENGYLYTTTESGGTVEIFKIGSGDELTHVHTLTLGGSINDIATDNGYLYVLCGNPTNALKIYSIDNPTAPSLTGSVTANNNPYCISVAGNYAYVGSQSGKSLGIYNITDKSAPTEESNTVLGIGSYEVFDIVASGNFVFMSLTTIGKIAVYNITNKAAPVFSNDIDSVDYPKGITIVDKYLYVNDFSYVTSLPNNTVKVYDITNKAAPVLVSTSNGASNSSSGSVRSGIFVNKNYIFLADAGSTTSEFYSNFFSHYVVSVSPSLASIITEECKQSKLITDADLDTLQLTDTVRGYKVTSVGAIRSAIEPLQGIYPFDVIQDGYKIKGVKRGGASVTTIESDKLGAHVFGQDTGVQITKVREMDSVLPAKVTIKYADFSREYDIGEQYYERINTDAINVQEMELPISLIASEAAGAAQTLCYLYWLERYDITFNLPPEFNYLQPADVITLNAPGESYSLRIKQINYTSDGKLEILAKLNHPAIYTPTATGEEGNIPPEVLFEEGNTIFELLDIPLVQDVYNQSGFQVALTGELEGWPGGVLSRSDDGGETYTTIQGFTAPGSTIGYATNIIGANQGVLLDKSSTLNVTLDKGTLSSVTELQMLNGQNHFAYGADGRWEIMGAQNCVLQADGTYVLSDFLRGRFGTEQYTGTHALNDAVVYLTSTNMAFVLVNTSNIGLQRHFKGVTSGYTLETATAKPFTYNGVNFECLNPVYLKASKDPTNEDINIYWTRRGRVSPEWRDLIDVPVGEDTEDYDIEIYADSGFTELKRTLTSTTSSVTYFKDDQNVDFNLNNADTNYSKRVLVLHFDGADGSTTFKDFSPNVKTVTAVGSTRISGNKCLFDGFGDYVNVANHADFDFGGNNFTFRFKLTLNGYAANNGGSYKSTLISKDEVGNRGFLLSITGSASTFTTIEFIGYNAANVPETISTAFTFKIGTTYDIEIVRSSNTILIFVDGDIINGSGTPFTTAIRTSTAPVKIGANNYDATIKYYLNGTIDELYMWKNVVLHVSAFSPPTQPYSDVPTLVTGSSDIDGSYSSVVLLLPMSGTNYSTIITDNSPTPKTVTANGNASINTSQNKFGSSSCFFDGSGDYLSIPSTAGIGLGTSDFIISCWVRPVLLTGSDRAIIDFRASFTANNITFFIDSSTGGKLAVWDGTTKYGGTGTALTINNWHHVKFRRSGNTLTAELNGSVDFSAAFTTDCGTSKPIGIGGSNTPGQLGTSPFNGYIDDFYLYIGSGLTNFSMPSSPFADSSADVNYNNRILGLHFEFAGTQPTFTDISVSHKTVTANGTAQISNAIPSPYSGVNGSGLFVGAGNKLTIPSGADFDMGTGDFTLESWVYSPFTGGTSDLYFISCFGTVSGGSGAAANGLGWGFLIAGGGTNTKQIQLILSNSTNTFTANTAFLTISPNVWHFIAVKRTSDVITFYLDGTTYSNIGNSLSGLAINNPNHLVTNIGGGALNTNANFYPNNAYISDLRLTKGVARTFATPTAPFETTVPSQSVTTLSEKVSMSTLYTKIYQKSAIVGRGYPATKTLIF